MAPNGTKGFDEELSRLLAEFDELLSQDEHGRFVVALPKTESSSFTVENDESQKNAGLDRLSRLCDCLRLLDLDRRATEGQSVMSSSGRPDSATKDSDTEPMISSGGRDTSESDAREPDHNQPLRRIGRFQILRRLGQGGFGRVFLAEDPTLNRLVAIKIPRVETLATPDLQRRFVQESQFAARLHHPHLVPVYEAGQDGPLTYQVTEYCAGGSLADWLQRARTTKRGLPNLLPIRECVELLIAIAEGVHHAHRHGVLHRDLKPANILLHPFRDSRPHRNLNFEPHDAAGGDPPHESKIAGEFSATLCEQFRPMVSDFGLARLLEDAESSSDVRPWTSADCLIQQTSMAGTLSYMAPEQIEGHVSEFGPATDVYGLGQILFEVLTGRRMFPPAKVVDPQSAGSIHFDAPTGNGELMRELVSPQSLRPEVPRDLSAICLKCVAPRIRDRYSTAQELADDLRAFSRGEPVRARSWPWHVQLVRFSQRRPTIATLLFICGLLAVSLMVFGAWHLKRLTDLNADLAWTSSERKKQADAALRQSRRADEQARLASEQRAIALTESRRSYDLLWVARQREYAAEMMQASAFFQAGEISQMNEALQRFLPKDETAVGGITTPKADPDSSGLAGGDLVDDPRGFEWHYLWHQGQTLRPWAGHTASVIAAAFTEDRSQCYTIAKDDTIRLWNAVTGQLLETWELDGAGTSIHLAAAISADRSRAVISRDLEARQIGEAIVWDLREGRIVMRREFPRHAIESQAISSDGRIAVVAGANSIENTFTPFAQLWIPESDTVVSNDEVFRSITVDGTTQPVHSVTRLAFVPGRDELAVGVLVNGPGYWQYQLLQCPVELTQDDGGGDSFATPTADAVSQEPVSVSAPRRDGVPIDSRCVRDVAFGNPTQVGSVQTGAIDELQFSRSGRRLAVRVGTYGNRVDLWDWTAGRLDRSTEQFEEHPYAIAFDESGDTLGISLRIPGLNADGKPAQSGERAVTAAGMEFRRWDLRNGASEPMMIPVKRDLMFVQAIPAESGGGWFIGEGGGMIYVSQPDAVTSSRSLIGHGTTEVWGLTYSPDGSKLYSVGDDHSLRAWETVTGRELAAHSSRDVLVSCVAVSPDGRLVAAGGYDDEILIHDATTLDVTATLKGHTHDIRAMAFSKDGRFLASAGRDKVVRVWDTATFTASQTFEGHRDTIRALHWMSNGQLMSADSDGRIINWSADGHIVRERTEPEGVHCFAFAPSDLRVPVPEDSAGLESLTSDTPGSGTIVTLGFEQLLVFGTRHGTIRFWHLPADRIWFEARHPAVDLRSLALSPDGRTLAVAGDDQKIHVWHTSTGRLVMTLDDIASAVNHIAFSPDGTQLAAALHDGGIRLYSAP